MGYYVIERKFSLQQQNLEKTLMGLFRYLRVNQFKFNDRMEV